MTEDDLNMSNEQLLDNLGLLEHGKLKRAAILLFHRNPEKWVTGAYIKIGYSLPKAAVRDVVYNAIIHSNYAALVPIQIRIHEDAVYISNDCVFPVGWTVETLMERHRSQPYNPNIANGFFRAGYVKHGDVG